MEILPLSPPDSFHLEAARGWLELGNVVEANEDLERIEPQLRHHPDVLKTRWEIYINAGKWEMTKQVSGGLTVTLPSDPDSWRLHANSYYFAAEYEQAYQVARAKVDEFSTDWKLSYDLACYCCRLSRLDEAGRWISRAMELGDEKAIKLKLLSDPDLEPLLRGSEPDVKD